MAGAGTGETGGSALEVDIVSWGTVATWTWDVDDENCGICRMPFDGYCSNCALPGDDCPLVWGKCTHAFHMHCILRWLEAQHKERACPMCRQPWEFQEQAVAGDSGGGGDENA